jgi:predicted nucleic-acid-binding protein
MKALDTNVVVRFLVRDDEHQAKRVYRLFKQAELAKEKLYIPILVVLELIWVLQSAYDKSRDDVLQALESLRRMPILVFESDDAIDFLISAKKTTGDLPDLLIACSAKTSGCDAVLTFDRKASRSLLFQVLKN